MLEGDRALWCSQEGREQTVEITLEGSIAESWRPSGMTVPEATP